MDLIRFPSSAPDTDPFPWVSNFLSENWKVLKVETWVYSRERVGVFKKRRREGDLNPEKNLYRKCKTVWIVKVGESYKKKKFLNQERIFGGRNMTLLAPEHRGEHFSCVWRQRICIRSHIFFWLGQLNRCLISLGEASQHSFTLPKTKDSSWADRSITVNCAAQEFSWYQDNTNSEMDNIDWT